jgi:hypothetical protein
MCFLQHVWKRLDYYLHVIAILFLIIFSSIASIGVFTIIRDQTVFMTKIHGLFLNPFFLITGAYLGIYLIYRMWIIAWMKK